MTASAASVVAPPANTAKRPKASASRAFSRRWLQSIVARRVRWRSGASRRPCPRPSSTGARRAFSSWTSSSVVRAAASSMASGSPSRWRQISATALALSSVSSKPWSWRRARSTNSAPAAACATALGSASAWEFVVGRRRSAARLAVPAPRGWSRSRSRAGAVASSSLISGAAGRRCSKLSSTSSPCFGARKRSTARMGRLPLEWRDAHGWCDRARNVLGTRGRGERNEPGAVPILALKPPRHLERQPRLAHPARPDKGDQAGVVSAQQLRHGGAVRLAADGACQRGGQANARSHSPPGHRIACSSSRHAWRVERRLASQSGRGDRAQLEHVLRA